MKSSTILPNIDGKSAAIEQFTMSADHLKKCLFMIFESLDALTSARATVRLFPAEVGLAPGVVNAACAVESFTDYIEKRLDIMLSILNNEYEQTADTENA